jgi:hypothetical protein
VDDFVARCFVNESGGESPLFQKKINHKAVIHVLLLPVPGVQANTHQDNLNIPTESIKRH